MATVSGQSIENIVRVSSENTENKVKVSNNQARYYSEIAREWATSDTLVESVDYSSKHYAMMAKNASDIIVEHIDDIDAVVADLANIDAVADNIDDVNSVGNNISDVSAIADDLTNINLVAADLENVDDVAGSITNINAVAADLTNIDNASSYADLAEDWANKMDGTVDGVEYSAKYYAQQASQGQIQANWNETDTTSKAYIKNKPTIPTVNNATLTIQKNGTNVETFTANASSNKTANIIVPTKTSDLTNDSNFATTSQIPTNNNQLINGAEYITGITSSDVTTALGYTPYDSTNPSGYTSNIGTVTSVNNIQPVNGNVTVDLNGKLDIDGSNSSSKLSDTFISKFMPDYVNGVTFTGTITLPCPALVRAFSPTGENWSGCGFYIDSVLFFNSSLYTSTVSAYADKGSVITNPEGTCIYYPLKGAN